MDASLLEIEYDAVVVGTGMAEAILAGALARVGKKVLHLDQNDYYGSNYASFPLEQFLRWTRNEDIAPRSHNDDLDAASSPTPVDENASTLPDDACVVPLNSSFRCHLVEQGFNVSEDKQAQLLRQSSQFSIDVNPRLVLSSEEIVQMLITSGVGRYLEFAAIERTYVHVQEKHTEDTIWEVPCSKKDVFSSKLLGMVEKRMLMKFLQFVADYGETHILGEDVKSKNERELALGRSLKRPQNKVNQVDVGGDAAIDAYLDRPFQDLLSQHFKLSSKLQQVVVYCVALASFPVGGASSAGDAQQMSAREGLAAVYRYVASIGRYTGNAFLVPLYGVSEITQSFCRLCAVYGGIYVLRAPIDGFVVQQEEAEKGRKLVGIHCTDGAIIRAKHVITNASYLSSFLPEAAEPTPPSQVLRGVFLLSESLRDGMNRFMVVIPPEDATLRNPYVIQAIQLDYGAFVCPKGHFLVQITMPLPSEWQGETAKQKELMDAIIKRLIESAIAEKATTAKSSKENKPSIDQVEGSTEPVDEISPPLWSDVIVWKTVYAMDHHLFHYSNATKKAPYVGPGTIPDNFWVCETSFGDEKAVNPLEIHLESASINARAIFEKMCPGEDFLPKSASAEQAEREELEDEQDAVLKAAQRLAEQTHVAAETASASPSTTPEQTNAPTENSSASEPAVPEHSNADIVGEQSSPSLSTQQIDG